MMKILSLGAGVQSSTILLMSIRGELPRIDHCIFADVGWEPREVYDWMVFLQAEADKAGIPIHTVSAGNLRDDMVKSMKDGKRGVQPPVFTVGEDGRVSIIQRNCTQDYKIIPIQRKVKELMGHIKGSRLPKEPVVEQWIGISGDEIQRMKVSQEPWMRFWHPLIETRWTEGERAHAPMRRQTMTRLDCQEWLVAHGYPPAPRSACIGCPFHDNAEWRKIRRDPKQWQDAVEFDEIIRHGFEKRGMKNPVYLHRSMLPLSQAPIDTEIPGQRAIGWDAECHGVCGV